MKKQVIQNFLNLPGIVGLALMDGLSRPYFCGIDQSLNFQQKEALTQGIQQVISTTPASFEAFEFRFSQRDARIYKLDSDIILLVVTNESLDASAYHDAVMQLKETLQADLQNTVSTFRLLAGSSTLSKQQYWSKAPADSAAPPRDDTAAVATQNSTSTSTVEATYRWDQGIAALNTLTDATAQYLGKIVVANTWRSTRPEGESLASLETDRSGHFSYSSGAEAAGTQSISSNDHEVLHCWVQSFIQRCSKIIRDYPEIVLNQALNDQQRAILRIETHEG